jgi:hypothetical protein
MEPILIGPRRALSDPEISPEERSVHDSFCDLHHLEADQVRVASLTEHGGKTRAIVLVVGIETMRKIARSTGKWDRVDPPVFERDAFGYPAAATVRVRRTDLPRGMSRTAFWHERAPRADSAVDPGRWLGEPDTMLAEVAEALVLRLAFPQALEGVYTEGDLDEALRDQELGRVQAGSDLRRQLNASE